MDAIVIYLLVIDINSISLIWRIFGYFLLLELKK